MGTNISNSGSDNSSDCDLELEKPKNCVCQQSKELTEFDFPQGWNELRLSNQLFDGVIRCDDGMELKIHRVILAANSTYFKILFANSGETSVNVDVSSDVMESLLDYAYTGHCSVTESNVSTLLQFSVKFEIIGVLKLCSQFLIDNLTPSNCLGTKALARQYFCPKFVYRIRLYALYNFNLIIECPEFLELSFLDLKHILRADELNVRSELILLEAIHAWIRHMPERTRHLFKLLKCVRIGNLPDLAMAAICKWPLIQQSPTYVEILKHTIKSQLSVSDDDTDHYIFRPRIPYEVMFVIGGYTDGSPTNLVETYDIRADRWVTSPVVDSVCRANHGLCALNGLVYLIGGFDHITYYNTVRCLDPVTHIWSERACMYRPRCFLSVAVHDSKIYALGGYNGVFRMNSGERYTAETNQWENIASMRQARSNGSAAALADKIYIVGGFNGNEFLNSAEVYNPSANQWTFIRPMTIARSGVSLVALHNTLYAVGGYDGGARLRTCEKMTPNCEPSWQEFTPMAKPRSDFAIAVLDNYIFVIGGYTDKY